ncbi:hypothetical protein JST99_04380 [Candidatus Dependentiae bacterium]|nr:hypothetical protein [Candidatus Dependentiae bacterium]MCC7415405.1 hypothetical protein [Campylobacterota bacterium]
MYKNIALVALLLPFSGYAITKQERQIEILLESREIGERVQWLKDVLKSHYWILFISGDSFRKEAKELHERAVALDKEFKAIELELMQEKACTNK